MVVNNLFWLIVIPWIVSAFAFSLNTFLNSLISVDTFVFNCLLGFIFVGTGYHVAYLIIPATIFFVVDVSLGLISLTRLINSSSKSYSWKFW